MSSSKAQPHQQPSRFPPSRAWKNKLWKSLRHPVFSPWLRRLRTFNIGTKIGNKDLGRKGLKKNYWRLGWNHEKKLWSSSLDCSNRGSPWGNQQLAHSSQRTAGGGNCFCLLPPRHRSLAPPLSGQLRKALHPPCLFTRRSPGQLEEGVSKHSVKSTCKDAKLTNRATPCGI